MTFRYMATEELIPLVLTTSMVIALIAAIAVIASQWLVKDPKTRKVVTNIGGITFGLMVVALFFGYSNALPDSLKWLNDPMFKKSVEVSKYNITFSTAQQPTYSAPRSTPTSSNICAVEDTTVTVSAVDKFTESATGGTHRYRINGNPALTVSDAGTFTASPGDSVEVLFGNETSGTYYGAVKKEKLPCSGTATISEKLVNNKSLTVEVFNEEGNLVDTNGENETLAAGDVVTLTAKLKGPYQGGFPYGGIIVAEFNSSDFDEIVVNFGGKKIGNPDFYTVSNTANSVMTYEVPAFLSNEILEGSVTLDVDASNNPGNANDPTLKFYPYDYYTDEDNGGIFAGPDVEDEDDARTFGYSATFTLSVD